MNTKQKLTGLILLTSGLSCIALAQNTQAADGQKPNIVFILMDNLGYGEVGCYGGGIARGAPTPPSEHDKFAAHLYRSRREYRCAAHCVCSTGHALERLKCKDWHFLRTSNLHK
jgi:hypothetical protein